MHLLVSLSLFSESPRFLKHIPFVQTFSCLIISESTHLKDVTATYLATEATAATQGTFCKWGRGHAVLHHC